MDKMKGLIGCFEFMSLIGFNVELVSKNIYTELIDMGYISSNLKNEHEVADMILIDFKYNFINEDILEFLVFHIIRSAIIDSCPELIAG